MPLKLIRQSIRFLPGSFEGSNPSRGISSTESNFMVIVVLMAAHKFVELGVPVRIWSITLYVRVTEWPGCGLQNRVCGFDSHRAL
jgi:hypothetical protein